LRDEPGFGEIRSQKMYHALWRMERDGIVLCDREGGGYRLPQRCFELTGLGEAYLESLAYSRADPEEEKELFFRLYDEIPAWARGHE
jgi:DNA-binding PadR family transcriptional regulator